MKDGNSQQSTLAWEWGYDTKDQKGRLFSGSHTELEQVIPVDQANALVQEVGDGLRYYAGFRGMSLVFLLKGRRSHTALQMLEMSRVRGE
jgi:hypothetical protein